MPVDRSSVRFYHQLLQEYFAAREMLRRMVSPSPQPSPSGRGSVSSPPQGGTEGDLEKLWRWPWWLVKDMPLWKRPENNYDPLPAPPQTNWEETTILAAGLALKMTLNWCEL
jgi:hypothetical protein